MNKYADVLLCVRLVAAGGLPAFNVNSHFWTNLVKLLPIKTLNRSTIIAHWEIAVHLPFKKTFIKMDTTVDHDMLQIVFLTSITVYMHRIQL